MERERERERTIKKENTRKIVQTPGGKKNGTRQNKNVSEKDIENTATIRHEKVAQIDGNASDYFTISHVIIPKPGRKMGQKHKMSFIFSADEIKKQASSLP